jgi:hypothetical protein
MSLTFEQAKTAALDARVRVLTDETWKVAFTGAEPQEPLRVKAPAPQGDYYIVEFRQTNRPTGLMLVDATTGEVSAITGVQAPGRSLGFLAPEAIPAALMTYRHRLVASLPTGHVSFGDFRDGLVADLQPSNLTLQRELIWEPCDQSLTPFKPFYQVQHTPPSRIDKFLVRADGIPYPITVTDGGRGM